MKYPAHFLKKIPVKKARKFLMIPFGVLLVEAQGHIYDYFEILRNFTCKKDTEVFVGACLALQLLFEGYFRARCVLCVFIMCCSVLQCVAVCCSVLQCVALCVAVCCSVLQCVCQVVVLSCVQFLMHHCVT